MAKASIKSSIYADRFFFAFFTLFKRKEKKPGRTG